MEKVKMKEIEEKWQKKWLEDKVFEADVSSDKKYMVTFPYPYINLSPHAGHAFSFLKCDLIARYKRMQGFNVLFSQGFHATGEPIVGAAKRVASNEETQIAAFKKIGLSDDQIKEMADPLNIVTYFLKEWEKDLKAIGAAIDWRRTFFTTKMNEGYNNFITWQYHLLKKKGYVAKGTHPVIWCPHDKSPTGSHDRKEGENANIVEYLVLKFKVDLDNDTYVLPAATLRPETLYGVVNMWVRPDAEYVKAEVDGEKWIASKECFEKLAEQQHDVKEIGTIKGQELIGKRIINPLTPINAIVLPADFVKLDNATGIVMSVPTHAPYDYVALRELQDGKKEAFGVDLEDIRKIKPIVLIKTEGLKENPAKAIVDDMKIKTQDDKKLETATKMVYRAEFHKGVLNENTGPYKGMKVKEVKDKMTEDLVNSGNGIIMYETSEDIVCRCMTSCFVKIIKDQWFLTYSDKKWKDDALKSLENSNVWPNEARNWMEHAILNMKDKACARRSGLGTPMPWDKEWIIEPLSDSTIYMAYYTISKFVNNKTISPKNMTPEFFDYVLLGKDIENALKTTGLKASLLKEIREEFLYFYPVDLRSSGKDLLSHHLVFFLYHHAAIFGKENWPKGIAANGWVTVDGEKMSKSKGNFVSMREAIDGYGADGSRMSFLDSYSGLDDVDFRRDAAYQYMRKMEEFLTNTKLSLENLNKHEEKTMGDRYLLSKTQSYIQNATDALEQMDNGTAFQNIFWGLYSDINRYIQKGYDKKILKDSLEIFAKLISPFAPHFAEELWLICGNNSFVCQEKWPKVDERLIDKEAEASEEIMKQVMDDIRQVRKLVKFDPKKITIFVAHGWRFKVYELAKTKNQQEIIAEMGSEMKNHGKEIVNYIVKLKQTGYEIKDIVEKDSQLKILEIKKSEIEKETGLKIIIENADKSKEAKANTALPDKPGLLLV
ncbi:leucine--tRNA ligase [archaeon]|nr:leucine--tRNA ligase [archaeon]